VGSRWGRKQVDGWEEGGSGGEGWRCGKPVEILEEKKRTLDVDEWRYDVFHELDTILSRNS